MVSDPETMNREMDLESGTVEELNKPAPGMWQYPTNPELCCIYRVPICLREVNPEAYTPKLVLIGPLHHSLKSQALKSRGDITNAKLMGYLNTEEHKKIYLTEFSQRFNDGNKTVDGFRRIIKEDEDMIRASYSESTTWIQSQEFVEMILLDSVFILQIMLKCFFKGREKIGDPLVDEPCLGSTITGDLTLLENQLPYFILEKLYDPLVKILSTLGVNFTLRKLVTVYFELDKKKNKIGEKSTFRHFTDLFRCVRVETLPENVIGDFEQIEQMYNAEKLHSRGVKFEAVEEEFSLYVSFDLKTGCMKIPCFWADDEAEIELRNIMAFEQSHYPQNAHVCNYVMFLDYLVDTEKDVDLLVEKGVIKNWLGHNGAVAKLLNNLCLGVGDDGSYYSRIGLQAIGYYKDKCNKSRAILKRVYFNNLWRGTATVTASCILLLTLTQTVTSIIQIIQD